MDNIGIQTQLVHGGTKRSQYREMSEALYLTQGYAYETAESAEMRFEGTDPGFVYSRFANPTVSMFEDRIALLEGAEIARATASGMAAVTAALLGQLKCGDHVIASKLLFGSCRYIIEDLLPRFGVDYTFVDGNDLRQWKRAARPNTKTFFMETPTNPTLRVYDIAEIAALAHSIGATLIVDNALASPITQNAFKYGADCVVYSATKHIDGQGRCLAGIILGSEDFMKRYIFDYLKQTGPTLSPFNAWVLLKSMETLHLRVSAQQASAAKIVTAIQNHPSFRRIIYPGDASHPDYDIAQKQMAGGGTVICLEMSGGKRAAYHLCNSLKIIKISNNFGDAKSIVTHPSTTTHQRLSVAVREEMGITDGTLRLSVGLEDADDLIADLSAKEW